MRRIVLAMSLSLALVMSLASFASAGVGNGSGVANAYGHRIKACTGLSYGQLKKAAKAGTALAVTLPPGSLDQAVGAKVTWEYIRGQGPCLTPSAP